MVCYVTAQNWISLLQILIKYYKTTFVHTSSYLLQNYNYTELGDHIEIFTKSIVNIIHLKLLYACILLWYGITFSCHNTVCEYLLEWVMFQIEVHSY